MGLDATVLALRAGPAGPTARVLPDERRHLRLERPRSRREILAWAGDALTNLGLTDEHFEFRISHRDILGGVLESYDADLEIDEAIRAVDKSDKLSTPEYHDALVEAGLTYDQAAEFDDLIAGGDLEDVAAFADSERVDDAVSNLQNVLEAAEDFGAREHCTISLETARGLDYYTGVVFECFDSTGEVSRSIFGGGRYDDLIESFGGQPTPAVGVAPGHATLSLLCQRAGVWPEEEVSTDYYVLQIGDTRPEAARISRDLRERGHVVETDVAGRSFGAQLNYADSINAETVVIAGEQDLENDEVTIKNMESGDQTQVPVEEFPGDLERPTISDFE